jgi:hypothetical protein
MTEKHRRAMESICGNIDEQSLISIRAIDIKYREKY